MSAVRIDAADDRVWRRTLDAVEASNRVAPTLTVRCDACRRALGYVGEVPGFGALFTASWDVPTSSAWRIDGEALTERQARRWQAHHTSIEVDERGPQRVDDRHGTLALLRLPEDHPAEYPALLVRCARHGDSILDRDHVLETLDRGAGEIVAVVSRPLTEYEPPRHGSPDSPATTGPRSSRSVTIHHHSNQPR